MFVQRTESAEQVSTNNFYAWITSAQPKDSKDNSFITLENVAGKPHETKVRFKQEGVGGEVVPFQKPQAGD